MKVKIKELYLDSDEPEFLQRFETLVVELEDKNKNGDLTINWESNI